MDRLDPSKTGPRCECGTALDDNQFTRRAVRIAGVDGVVPICKHCATDGNGGEYRSTLAAVLAYQGPGGVHD